MDVPGARAGGGKRTVRRAAAATEHGRDAARERFLDLLGRDEVDVGIHAACSKDTAFAGDDLGAGADDDGDAGLGIGIAGLADGADAAVAQADIGLVDAGDVHDQRVGDDGVDGALGAGHLALAHAVTDDLAAAELDLFAVDGEVLLDLDEKLGVCQPHLVASGRAVHVGIGGAGNAGWHDDSG